MKFSELTRLDEIGVRRLTGRADADFSDVCYDSRRVTEGALFVAVNGFASDGHLFIQDAILAGATTIVLENPDTLSEDDASKSGITRILVENSRRALAIISEEFFGNPSKQLRLIGVTGTNGKTTVTHSIKELLEGANEKVGLIGTIGNMIGDRFLPATHTTPESREVSELIRKMVDEGVTTCVMEVSSHALVLSRVLALDFDIAVFTNLSQDHLDFHHSMEEYLAAKSLLFNSLKPTAVAITNADDEFGQAVVAHTAANTHTYGVQSDPKADPKGLPASDLYAKNVQTSIRGTRFEIRKRYSEERAVFESSFVGGFNVENILAAVSALYFGVSGFGLEVLAELLKRVKPVRGRFETIALPNHATAIIDYAHTPDALDNVLKTISSLRPDGARTLTLFGCGGDRDRGKRPQMGRIAAAQSDLVFLTNDNPRSEAPESIVNEIVAGIPAALISKVEVILNRKEAIVRALMSSRESDIILLAGKGHETYQILGTERLHFDDREVVKEWAQTL